LPRRYPNPFRRASLAALGALPLLAGCSARTLVEAVTPTGHYRRHDDIAYGPGPRHRLDLYVPLKPDPRGAPCVAFFYGGAWQRGQRALYAFVGEALASRGFVTAVADYRVYPEVTFPGFVEDGALATAWLAGNARRHGGDPARIFVAGHSAGAHIAMLVALDPRYLPPAGAGPLAGAVGLSGPYDFLPLESEKLRSVFGAAAGAPATQPITFARRDAPPLLLLHGSDDTIVKPGNSERLAQRMEAVGGRAELRIYEGIGHAGLIARLAAPFRGNSTVLDDIARFVDGAPA
jgi:acetyl esterase/lipase